MKSEINNAHIKGSPKIRFLENDKLLIILLLIILAIKLPFIFHGKWDEKFFVPYMTDEVVFLAPIYSYVVSGNFNLDGLIAAYPPFHFNILITVFSK